ncbi:hypothetical protein F0160_22385 [Paraburkholderia sp. JPY303]|uniref:hypothetical protein n=1 Tax=Paraburkholderia atlantica TaxID=2654982 RepID=UPI0015923F32|nr:hypothetical protein [Paraburkholderia atlantica]NUY33236.1 hypothetical protein [Paraburkholderia atlantica]
MTAFIACLLNDLNDGAKPALCDVFGGFAGVTEFRSSPTANAIRRGLRGSATKNHPYLRKVIRI